MCKILLFQSVRQVIKAESCLKSLNFAVKIIPVPRHITSECGMCIEISEIEVEAILQALASQNINGTITDKNIKAEHDTV